MKKSVLSCLLAIALMLTAVLPSTSPALAQSAEEVKAQSATRAALVIKAPRVADVSQPVAITVSEKHKHQPVAGVGVYALKADETANAADSSDYTAVIAHYASVEGVRAVYLGETDDDGTLAYQFANTGLYLLIAFKFEYVPDFAWLTVTLFAQQSLRIKAPDEAELGAPVTFKVVDRDTAVPVAGSALYAKEIGEISMPKVTSQTIISSTAKAVAAVANPVSPSETAVEFEIKESGIFLGYTGDNSELPYSFDQSGRYVLVAIKDNYAPGFAKIPVTLANREPLDVKAPRIAMIGEPGTITVVAQGIQLPVSRASVYVLKVGEFLANESVETVVPPEASNADEAVEYAVGVKKAGAFIGYTDDEGKVVHSFIRTGRYALVATKDGCIPGFAQIVITIAGQKALDVVAPGAAAEGRPVTIKAVEGATRWPVEVAGVYALKVHVIAAPAPIENGTDIRITTAEPANLSEAERYALLAGRTGIFSGYTNGAGEVVHSFAEPGLYILVAVKDGYEPGFTRITIHPFKVGNPAKTDMAQPSTINSSKAE